MDNSFVLNTVVSPSITPATNDIVTIKINYAFADNSFTNDGLSFNFNNNLLIGNPAKGFFGEKAVVSRSVEIKELYDQEIDPEYINLDKVVRSATSLSPNQTIDFLINQNIKYIVFFQNLNGVDNLKYEFLASPNLKEKIR